MDFDKLNGLIPVVIQDDRTNDVLMVGFMNEEAMRITTRTGYVTFYSRTRQQLWTKGETSGNRLAVRTILSDCDDDTLLIRVEREGAGNVCHLGRTSCFTVRPVSVEIEEASRCR
jgi:phosphoribosyl-ATP pyrophosphohydrolase/phosphoribosyl-AMP cyclohydrolase